MARPWRRAGSTQLASGVTPAPPRTSSIKASVSGTRETRRGSTPWGHSRVKTVQGRIEWKPTEAFRTSLGYTKSRLVRDDTRRTAYDQDLYSLQTARRWGRFGFCRVRADFDSLRSRLRGQLVAGWTPNPGTAVYLGYDDDPQHDGFDPLTRAREPGLVRTGRTLFVKLSYLLRRGL